MKFIIFLLFIVGACLFFVGLCDSFAEKLSRRMIKNVKGLIIFVSIVFGCFVGLMYIAHGWGEAFDWTTDSVEQVIPSPIGDYIAYVYTIRGVMVSYSSGDSPRTVIILRPRSAPVFIKNDHIVERSNWWGGAVDDVIFRGYLSNLTWLSNEHLLIQ